MKQAGHWLVSRMDESGNIVTEHVYTLDALDQAITRFRQALQVGEILDVAEVIWSFERGWDEELPLPVYPKHRGVIRAVECGPGGQSRDGRPEGQLANVGNTDTGEVDPASPAYEPDHVTPNQFKAKVGWPPSDDDLERVNCSLAGYPGHLTCGWCTQHDRPRLVCGCCHKRTSNGER